MSARLTQAFFAREVEIVARDLLGRHLVRDRGTPDEVVLRITETEAYGGPEDTASHCRAGRTARNAPMWGPPGHAYVYVCYGLHQMLNLVTGEEGRGQAVLIRSCELVSGGEIVRARRRMDRDAPALLAGPGKVGAALALDRSFSGASLFDEGALEAHEGTPIVDRDVLVGPRVGVDYANARDRAAKKRFAIAGSRWVTHANSLRRARSR
ncbi:DNA-3-methyladenine glycosylase [Sandaracinus amylolyticus]|uniref:Putative 3-methyladenine DNA glycosylase n=1 Tax=Sandaracinus amylolyticus TaxID=927083 RepID=A0A0F6W4I9_9BACT|nr:DNA-3-methyladenine glycosylase [Sandaracinus amylolyticus]AKF07108.1 DNA-3-methyladenine glycosylase II [Sandaracinus amylolyticus]